MNSTPTLLSSLLAICIVATVSHPAKSQAGEEATIEGTVNDYRGQPAPNASVILLDETEGDTVEGTASETDGSFTLEADPGSYVLRISYISMELYSEQLEVSAGETLELGTIEMEESTEQLEELEVTGEPSQMTMDFDRRVFQAGSDVTNAGGSALEVMENVPSISTDIDGNVSLRGSESVRILINGRPSAMFRDGTEALQTIPASMIEEVEVITNPSSRYEAEGGAGVINIILKEEQDFGFNGSVMADAGYPENYGLSTNLNYRTSNVNWFLNAGGDFRSEPETGFRFQEYTGPDTTYSYRQDDEEYESEGSGNFRGGAEIFIGDTQTLLAEGLISLEDENNETDTDYTDYRQDDTVLQNVIRRERETEGETDLEFSLDYENLYDEEEDHRLRANAQYSTSSETEASNLDESIEEGTGDPLHQRTENQESFRDLMFRADYERPLAEDMEMEAGVRSSFEWLGNDYIAEELQDNEWTVLPEYNQNFEYNEFVHAAYGMFSHQVTETFSYQAGLRAEYSDITGELSETGEKTNSQYIDFFPSASLNFEVGDENAIQVNYSRRLSRPWSRMLLPFSNLSDTRNQFTGNPDLDPEYTNSFETGYLYRWGGGSLFSSVYYRHRTGVHERITRQEGDGITRELPINLSTEHAYGFEFNFDQDLAESLSLNGTLNLYRSERDGEYEGQNYDSETSTASGRLGIRWRFLDGWDYESYLRYRGPETTTQGSQNAFYFMNAGVAKTFFEGKLRLRASVRDLFDSMRWNNLIDEPNFYSEENFQWSTRTFRLSVTYNFNSGQGQQGGDGPPGR